MRIASWNVEGRLSRYSLKGRGTPEQIVHGINRLDADVVFLPEAYTETTPVEPEINESLERMGYQSYDVPYIEGGEMRENKGTGVNHPVMRLLSRLSLLSMETIRLADLRNAMVVVVEEPETHRSVRVIGIHLDDRTEAHRLAQVNELVPIINGSEMPTILLGDFNAMWGGSKKAQLLRDSHLRALINLVPRKGLKGVAARASEMASGTTLATLETQTNLIEADSEHRPTTTPKMRGHRWLPSIRMIDIDHIKYSPELTVGDVEIGSHDGGSDHRPVAVPVSFKQ